MTRLLQAMAGAPHGGAEAFFERLALALQKAEIDQKALIRENPRRAELLRAGGVEVAELPFGGLLDIRTRLGFRRAIAEFRPEIVLTWMNRASQFCPRGPFVQVGRLGGYYDLKYYRHCRHLIGNTEDIVEYVIGQGWPKERAHYLPNFVTSRRAAPIPRKMLYTPEGAPLLLALGRLHRNKAFDVLIEALALVPDAYLWLAGEGPEKTALELAAEKAGVKPRIRFLGWRDDIPELFAAADVFVCPSRHEPLGNVVIESWAQGKPTIAADAVGPGALIRHGETGILVPVEDADALAAAIRWIFAEPAAAAEIGAAGHAAYLADFTEDRVVAKYLEFLDKVKTECAASPA